MYLYLYQSPLAIIQEAVATIQCFIHACSVSQTIKCLLTWDLGGGEGEFQTLMIPLISTQIYRIADYLGVPWDLLLGRN